MEILFFLWIFQNEGIVKSRSINRLLDQMKHEPKLSDLKQAERIFERDKKLGRAVKLEGTAHLILLDGASAKIVTNVPHNAAY